MSFVSIDVSEIRILLKKSGVKGKLPVAADASGLSSFKEPWVPKNCSVSIKRSGVYEAGGNLLWVDPETTGDTFMPSEDVSWASLHKLATTQFPTTAFGDHDRIRFLVSVQCWWRSGVQALSDKAFPNGGLAPLGGHAFIWGWYLAVFLALEGSEWERVKLLYESALTTTISMFTTESKADLAFESLRMSEALRTASQLNTDNFISSSRTKSASCIRMVSLTSRRSSRKMFASRGGS